MRIAIASEGEGPDSQISVRFGRARCFVIFDTDSGARSAAPNEQNLNASQGAGIQAATNVAGQEVQAVLCRHCGPKAFRVLQAAEINVYSVPAGIVREAIEAYRAGGLEAVNEADVEGHWV